MLSIRARHVPPAPLSHNRGASAGAATGPTTAELKHALTSAAAARPVPSGYAPKNMLASLLASCRNALVRCVSYFFSMLGLAAPRRAPQVPHNALKVTPRGTPSTPEPNTPQKDPNAPAAGPSTGFACLEPLKAPAATTPSQPAKALPFELYQATLTDADTRTVERCRTMNRQPLAVADDVQQKPPVKELRAIAAADASADQAAIARENSIISQAQLAQGQIQIYMTADCCKMRALEDAMMFHFKMVETASPWAHDLERAIRSLAPANLDAAQGVRVNAQHHKNSRQLVTLIEQWSDHAYVVIALQKKLNEVSAALDAAIHRRSTLTADHTSN